MRISHRIAQGNRVCIAYDLFTRPRARASANAGASTKPVFHERMLLPQHLQIRASRFVDIALLISMHYAQNISSRAARSPADWLTELHNTLCAKLPLSSYMIEYRGQRYRFCSKCLYVRDIWFTDILYQDNYYPAFYRMSFFINVILSSLFSITAHWRSISVKKLYLPYCTYGTIIFHHLQIRWLNISFWYKRCFKFFSPSYKDRIYVCYSNNLLSSLLYEFFWNILSKLSSIQKR